MTPQAQQQPQQPSQPKPQQTITPGMWIEVETVRGGPYIAHVKEITERGTIVLLLALTDYVTGSLLFKQAYVLPNEVVFWQSSRDPRQPTLATLATQVATMATATEPDTSAAVEVPPDANKTEVA